MKIVPTTDAGLSIAAEAIRAGEIVAYPTEAVYGLGADPFSEKAVRRLFELKGREETKPILLVISDPDQLERVARRVSPRAAAYAKAFWPGPLSMLFPKAQSLAAALTGGADEVCVRCPGSEIARRLCRAVGGPITSTSANRAGAPPARALPDVNVPGVAVGVDGGTLEPGPPSTVFDPTRRAILREGAVPASELTAFEPY
ncbi:MAG TPA: threonylcarbamoyl-AMP synthase [Candidatus Hydrogenedentes bacterium]|nr:threonylcarbamoyl-AMP synthase [Candidatus Hydrogenedentota bacterium]